MTYPPPTKGKIIVFGILFWYPLAGVTYQFLHYLLGLRKLGYDAYYIEDSGRWIYDPRIDDLSPDPTGNIAAMAPVLEAHGFRDRWCFRDRYPDSKCYGMTQEQLFQLYKDADACLSVTGDQEIREELLGIKRRIYVESDPFLSQVKFAKGDAKMVPHLHSYDTHFTFGENLGAPDCDVPLGPFNWLPTRQAVALELWPMLPPGVSAKAAYNTITTWHNQGKNLEYKGDTYYWTKDREFEKFLDLPQRRPNAAFELATRVDDSVRQRLNQNGWRVVSSADISKDVDGYRSYIQNSRGEFTVARDQYVRPKTGWFSDRTCCYLAAGRPVITQETGFSKYLPSGKGLFGFSTMDEILAAVDAIESDYTGNCKAARDIAEEYFAADKVVGSLLERAGI